jgi:hypothetical protein
MAIDIDGLAVLRTIAAAPRIFPDAATEINGFARKYISGQLKQAKITLERLRDIYRAIGGKDFELILDDPSAPASSLVKKLDKDNPELDTKSSPWCRKRLADLASGAVEPARKPLKAPKKEPASKRPTLTPEQKDIAAGLKKAINLEKARGLWRETGEASFTFVLASLTDKQALDLAKRLDKDNPDLKTAPPDQLRQRIADLARGTAEPVFKNILENEALEAALARPRKVK